MPVVNPSLHEQSLGQTGRKRRSGFKKFLIIAFSIALTAFIAYIFFSYYFVVGDGVKSGHLNFAVRKGYLFKTYEGKLIQEGYKINLQSNEFEFSIKTKKIYDILSMNSGKIFDLHYKEYSGVVPWRGNSKYVVDSIISMRGE